MIGFVDPLADLGPLLLSVEKPARYTGGEYGSLCSKQLAHDDGALKTLIAFPDLYEIGMSNQAIRIIYNCLNKAEGILCDRAFAPAPDFEELLRKKGLPLYGLDTGISLKRLDLLMFTLGYELGITGVFAMLDISDIPLRSCDRGADDPLVIMGGPCVSNPLPYSAFIDAFWIGEAEAGFFDLAGELADLKKSGAKREGLLQKLEGHPSVWTKGKGSAVRAIYTGFGAGGNGPAVFPVPSMKVVHHHGSVEIMRGCPNGCRFCHAGYWYRPMRQKSALLVESETEAFIRQGGYSEISLSSLSSGDYRHLDELIDNLNARFQGEQISFQLPSLRVSGFSLSLLEKISEVRKSGLTFAVETPSDFWQMAINKQVSGEDITAILTEAKRRGWKSAKFYFMVGLPLDSDRDSLNQVELKSEEEEIALFVEKIARRTGMHFNINIGTFVPKPHTPFQWAAQLNREESERKLNFIRTRLKAQGHKVGLQDALLSVIEGVLSRGGEGAGELAVSAFMKGCRLDSWNEHVKRDVWESILTQNKELIDEIFAGKPEKNNEAWSCINSGFSKQFFTRESEKSLNREITSSCMNNCNSPCGVCNVKNIIQYNEISKANLTQNIANFGDENDKKSDPHTLRMIFSFAKQGSAVFHSHLGLMEIFSMAFKRSGIPVLYSQGFNPLPKLDIASPLSLGISTEGEIAAIDLRNDFQADRFMELLNRHLPGGFKINKAMNVLIPSGAKKHSVSSLLWGFEYEGDGGKADLVEFRQEKEYRQSRTGSQGSIFNLKRMSVLAKDINTSTETPGVSYFDVYKKLYG